MYLTLAQRTRLIEEIKSLRKQIHKLRKLPAEMQGTNSDLWRLPDSALADIRQTLVDVCFDLLAEEYADVLPQGFRANRPSLN